jgi:predicted nuclease of predicted toxin-antitoxin system
MRLKLDENLDARLAILLREAGHNVATVPEQGLRGIADTALFRHCASEGFTLVTLDLDFANVLRFPPERSPGLVVLRGPSDLFPTLRLLVRTLIAALAKGDPSGRLWIIEPGRVRIHEAPAEAEE